MNYIITKEPTEEIELRVEDDRYSLVHWTYPGTTAIILNKREAIRLYLVLGIAIRGDIDESLVSAVA